jgi:hypothetical protein
MVSESVIILQWLGFVSSDYSDFHQSFVRELTSGDFSGLEEVLEKYLPKALALASGDLNPAALAYWAWVAGQLLYCGLLPQAERVLEVAGQTCIRIAIDKVSRELLFCDLRSQLLRHLSCSCRPSEKSVFNFLGKSPEIAQAEEVGWLGVYTLLALSLVYEKTADFERASNLIERANMIACRCEILPETFQRWIDKKSVVLKLPAI